MPRPTTPSLRRHKASQQGIVTLNGRDHYMGHWPLSARKPPQHVQRHYDRLITEWLTGGRRLTPDAEPALAIAELIDRYVNFARDYYRHQDNTPTKEVGDMVYALRPLNHLYGDTAVTDFGPIALKSVRQLMIDGYLHPQYGQQPALSRGVVNQRVKRIRRVFKWGVEQEIVKATVLHALQALAGLKRGRSQAYETDRVKPVSRTVVDDTLELLRPLQRDMVTLQLESGMRPGELVAMRCCDLDVTGTVWLYRPSSHKTLHHGHERIIPLGPRCQAIVKRYLVHDTQAHLFMPSQNMKERAIAMRATRRTKVQPSQHNRRKQRPKKTPGDFYTVDSYRRGITQAIQRHNRGKPEAEHIPHWHPHQLRHLRALEVKREAGLDAARAVLGHRSPVITEHYATLDVAKGIEVMARIG